MAIPVVSVHTATLVVPNSGQPADKITVEQDDVAKTISISAQGSSPADARQKVKDFLDAARQAAQG